MKYWHDKHYLIIDKISMVSCKMFSKLANITDQDSQHLFSEEPFDGLDVTLVSNFYQFPLWHQKCPHTMESHWNSTLVMPRCKLYEQFNTDQSGESHQICMDQSSSTGATRPRARKGVMGSSWPILNAQGLTDFSYPSWSKVMLATL